MWEIQHFNIMYLPVIAVTLNDGWFVNNELGRMWKEIVMIHLRQCPAIFLGGLKKQQFSQGTWCPNQESNWAPAR
jgi:hypothetical protein